MAKNRNPQKEEARTALPFIVGYVLLILFMFALFVMIVLAMVGVIG